MLLVCGLAGVLLAGCQAQSIGEVTAAEVEPTLKEYYRAFNDYEAKRIEALFTKSAWQENGSEN